jgi:hypothetical protein
LLANENFIRVGVAKAASLGRIAFIKLFAGRRVSASATYLARRMPYAVAVGTIRESVAIFIILFTIVAYFLVGAVTNLATTSVDAVVLRITIIVNAVVTKRIRIFISSRINVGSVWIFRRIVRTVLSAAAEIRGKITVTVLVA